MVAVLQYTTIIKIGAQRTQRSIFAQPKLRAYCPNNIYTVPKYVADLS